ncbi:hypothetical protein K438DRAFT_1988773 [Mycena galopus ATCC 62051]|nr:hypothetical protein K438DRAFT_1988773 [Mycena galopus ATCC 62051]
MSMQSCWKSGLGVPEIAGPQFLKLRGHPAVMLSVLSTLNAASLETPIVCAVVLSSVRVQTGVQIVPLCRPRSCDWRKDFRSPCLALRHFIRHRISFAAHLDANLALLLTHRHACAQCSSPSSKRPIWVMALAIFTIWTLADVYSDFSCSHLVPDVLHSSTHLVRVRRLMVELSLHTNSRNLALPPVDRTV